MQCRVQPCTCSPQPDTPNTRSAALRFAPFAQPGQARRLTDAAPHCPTLSIPNIPPSPITRKCRAEYSPALAPLNLAARATNKPLNSARQSLHSLHFRYAFIPLRRKTLFSGKETAVGASLLLAQPHARGSSNPAKPHLTPEARKPPPQRPVTSASQPLLPTQRSGSAAQHCVHELVRTVTLALHCYTMPAHQFASPHQRIVFSAPLRLAEPSLHPDSAA